MITIGVDPGVNGGMAIHWGEGLFHNRPNVGTRNFEELECRITLMEVKDTEDEARVFLEQVGGSPVQSSKTAFTFGENFGWWRGVLEGLGINYTLVRPTVWQKPYRADLQAILNKGMTPSDSYRARKNFFKDRAQELYPNVRVTLAVADAILLMHYGLTA